MRLTLVFLSLITLSVALSSTLMAFVATNDASFVPSVTNIVSPSPLPKADSLSGYVTIEITAPVDEVIVDDRDYFLFDKKE